MPSRVKTCTSMTVPLVPWSTRSEVSLHVAGLLAEDGAQQLLFRRQRGFALGRDLADQRVAGADFGTHVHDARLVEARQLLLDRFGMSRVISSAPSLVSRAITTSSSMWIEV